MRLVPASRRAVLAIAVLCSLLCACESAGPRESAPPAERPGVGDDPASQDQAAGLAAEDAEALRLKTAATQPARRPPRPSERRAVDQPRVSERRTPVRR